MVVPPHPHTGLQTVTWLLSGEVLHQDSLGSEQLVRPGALNLMTAGRGIAHAETSTPTSPALRGLQLWVALPDAARETAPDFEHHPELPVLADGALTATVLLGSARRRPLTCHGVHADRRCRRDRAVRRRRVAAARAVLGARRARPHRRRSRRRRAAARGLAALPGLRPRRARALGIGRGRAGVPGRRRAVRRGAADVVELRRPQPRRDRRRARGVDGRPWPAATHGSARSARTTGRRCPHPLSPAPGCARAATARQRSGRGPGRRR